MPDKPCGTPNRMKWPQPVTLPSKPKLDCSLCISSAILTSRMACVCTTSQEYFLRKRRLSASFGVFCQLLPFFRISEL